MHNRRSLADLFSLLMHNIRPLKQLITSADLFFLLKHNIRPSESLITSEEKTKLNRMTRFRTLMLMAPALVGCNLWMINQFKTTIKDQLAKKSIPKLILELSNIAVEGHEFPSGQYHRLLAGYLGGDRFVQSIRLPDSPTHVGLR